MARFKFRVLFEPSGFTATDEKRIEKALNAGIPEIQACYYMIVNSCIFFRLKQSTEGRNI